MSKKRQAECPRGHKLNDDVPYCMICGKPFTRVQPIPNCPDGRFRPRSKAPGQKREPVKH